MRVSALGQPLYILSPSVLCHAVPLTHQQQPQPQQPQPQYQQQPQAQYPLQPNSSSTHRCCHRCTCPRNSSTHSCRRSTRHYTRRINRCINSTSRNTTIRLLCRRHRSTRRLCAPLHLARGSLSLLVDLPVHRDQSEPHVDALQANPVNLLVRDSMFTVKISATTFIDNALVRNLLLFIQVRCFVNSRCSHCLLCPSPCLFLRIFFSFNTYFSFKTMTYEPATRHAILLYGTFESVVF